MAASPCRARGLSVVQSSHSHSHTLSHTHTHTHTHSLQPMASGNDGSPVWVLLHFALIVAVDVTLLVKT